MSCPTGEFGRGTGWEISAPSFVIVMEGSLPSKDMCSSLLLRTLHYIGASLLGEAVIIRVVCDRKSSRMLTVATHLSQLPSAIWQTILKLSDTKQQSFY